MKMLELRNTVTATNVTRDLNISDTAEERMNKVVSTPRRWKDNVFQTQKERPRKQIMREQVLVEEKDQPRPHGDPGGGRSLGPSAGSASVLLCDLGQVTCLLWALVSRSREVSTVTHSPC